MSYVYQEFPKWVYSAECPMGRIVQTRVELESLGPGWVDSAADVGKPPEPKELADTRVVVISSSDPTLVGPVDVVGGEQFIETNDKPDAPAAVPFNAGGAIPPREFFFGRKKTVKRPSRNEVA